MVDYQGPELFRGLIEAFDIPIFDRVSRIDYYARNFGDVKLPREDLVEMQSLKTITFKTKRKAVRPEDEDAVKKIVPPCRLAKVETPTDSQIAIQLNPNAFLCCDSQPSK